MSDEPAQNEDVVRAEAESAATSALLLRLVTAGALLVAAFAQGLGYYSVRSLQFSYLNNELGAEFTVIRWVITGQMVGAVVGVLSAVVLGALLGPLPTAALGLTLGAAGCALLASTSDPYLATLALVLTATGLGATRPAVFVGALRWFGQHFEGARLAMAFSLYAATNVAALLATSFSAEASEQVGMVPVFAAASALLLLAACFSVVPFAASWPLPAPSGPTSTETFASKPLASGLIAAALGAAAIVAWSVGGDKQQQLGYTLIQLPEWGNLLNPLLVALVCLIGAALTLTAQAFRVRPYPTLIAGFGALTMAAGLAPTALLTETDAPMLMLSMALTAIGEALFLPAIWAAAVGGVHFRAAMLPAAMLSGTGWLTYLLVSLVSGGLGGDDAVWLASLMAAPLGLLGLVLMAAAWPLRRLGDIEG